MITSGGNVEQQPLAGMPRRLYGATPPEVSPSATTSDIASESAEADAAFREGRAGGDVFPSRPSELCGYDFRRALPGWPGARAERPPWSGLGPE
jgi:hypothetical protein